MNIKELNVRLDDLNMAINTYSRMLSDPYITTYDCYTIKLFLQNHENEKKLILQKLGGTSNE